MTLRIVRAYPLGTASLAAASLAALLIAATPAAAQSSDIVTITPSALNASGRIAVNVAAGTFNQQANAAVLSESEIGVLARNIVRQYLFDNTVCTFVAGKCAYDAIVQKASIADGAFSGVSGAIAVNGAAGVENQQANLATFGVGHRNDTQIIALTALSQVRASQEPAGVQSAPAAAKTADISSQAFTNASGLVQINLTAGERNSSANIFALTIPGGTD